MITLDPGTSVPVGSGDVESLRVRTRIVTTATGQKCAGPGGSHGSAVGLRLYYDAAKSPSRLDATIAGAAAGLFLRSDGTACAAVQSAGVNARILDLAAPPTTAAKCVDSGPIRFDRGNAWQEIGTWSRLVP